MESNEGRDLHPETVEILAALVGLAAEPPAPQADMENLLARFVIGAASDDERQRVIEALALSNDLRIRMLGMRDELGAASNSLESRQETMERDPVLAAELHSALTHLLDVFCHWKSHCRQAFSSNLEAANAAWAFRHALKQFSNSMRPSAIATVRSGEPGGPLIVQPGGVQADLQTSVDAQGRFNVKAALNPPYGQEADLSLYAIGSDGGWVYLGTSTAHADVWELQVENFSEYFPSKTGWIQPMNLALKEDSRSDPNSVVKLVRTGSYESLAPLWIAVTQPPAVQNGTFSIALNVPDEIRAELDGGVIFASVAVGPFSYLIGEWPMDDLPKGHFVELTAPMAGVPDCEFEYLPAIHLSFRPR